MANTEKRNIGLTAAERKKYELTPEERLSDTTLHGILEFHSETGTEGGYWAFMDGRFINNLGIKAWQLYEGSQIMDAFNPERKGKVKGNVEVFLNDGWLPYPDPIMDDPDYEISSLSVGQKIGDKEADKRLSEKYGLKLKYLKEEMDEEFGKGKWQIKEDEHLGKYAVADAKPNHSYPLSNPPRREPFRPYGVKGDEISKFDVEWEDGTTERRESNTVLTEQWDYDGLYFLSPGDKLTIFDKDDSNKVLWEGFIALTKFTVFSDHVHGMWIHNRQKGVDMDQWGLWFMQGNPAQVQLTRNEAMQWERRMKAAEQKQYRKEHNERLHEILKETTKEYRKGDRIEEKDFEGINIKVGFDIPHVDEAPENLHKTDLVLLTIGVDKEKAKEFDNEIKNYIANYPELHGHNYFMASREVGGTMDALRLFALGEALDYWKVVRPGEMELRGYDKYNDNFWVSRGYIKVEPTDKFKKVISSKGS